MPAAEQVPGGCVGFNRVTEKTFKQLVVRVRNIGSSDRLEGQFKIREVNRDRKRIHHGNHRCLLVDDVVTTWLVRKMSNKTEASKGP